MEALNKFLINVSEKKKHRTYEIVDELLDTFKYTIRSDNFENDIRTITLKNNNYNNVIITSTIIFDNSGDKKEYVQIKYNKYLLKFSVHL